MSRETKLSYFRVGLALINLILTTINFKFNSIYLKGIIEGINTVIISECILLFIFYLVEIKKKKLK